MHKVVLIAGDGIGPEVTQAAVAVIGAAGVAIEWESYQAGEAALKEHGVPLPPDLLEVIRRNRVALKGPITTPIAEGFQSVNVALRKELDLYANFRPVRSLPGVPARYSDIDLVVIRENTEDLYSGIEHVVVPGVVESLKIITERASTRIARFAFSHARAEGRRKVTAVHKANIMKLSDGLFLECARRVAAQHPEIEYHEMIVDNACMQLVLNPWQFDVLLLENLYGDIRSDSAAGLVGGLGLVPGANIGDSCALFETVHGSAPGIAGKNIANPTAMILASVLMLKYIGEGEAASRIERALKSVYSEGKMLTRDLGGSATTSEFTRAVIAGLKSERV